MAVALLVSMKGINLNHLRYFHAIAERGSLAAAARHLGAAQSTVSEQIAQLERTLGEPVFRREAAGLSPTERGRFMFEQTRIIFDATTRITEAFRPSGPETSRLRVGQSASLSRTQNAAMLTPLFQLEDLDVRVRCGDGSEMLQALLRSELDLVLTDSEPPPGLSERVGTRALRGSELVVIVAEEHRSAVTSPADLSVTPVIQYAPSSRLHWLTADFIRRHAPGTKVAAEADDVGLLIAATRTGRFWSLVPEVALRGAADGLYVLHRLDSFAECHAVYSGGDPKTMVRRAIEALAA